MVFVESFDEIILKCIPENDETIHDRINNKAADIGLGVMIHAIKGDFYVEYFIDLVEWDYHVKSEMIYPFLKNLRERFLKNIDSVKNALK